MIKMLVEGMWQELEIKQWRQMFKWGVEATRVQ
jgi:hypothetical protein